MDSCELDPGGEDSEASPQHQCTKWETKSVRKATDCELKTYKRACWQRNIPPFAGAQRYEEMKNHPPTAPPSKPLAPPYPGQRSCLSRPTGPLLALAHLLSEGFSFTSSKSPLLPPSEALLLPPKRYYCCHPRGATGASDEGVRLPRLRHYSLPSKPAPSPAKETLLPPSSE